MKLAAKKPTRTNPANDRLALAALIAEIHALSAAGRFSEAFGILAKALVRNPADAELQFARGSVLFDWGRTREARVAFLQAEAGGFARVAIYLNLAWTCHLLHRPDEAERFARKAIELAPQEVAAHFGLGTVLQRQKRYAEAIACYEQTLALDPSYARGAAAIAHCKLELKDYVGGEEWMRRAVALDANNPQFWTNLGVALANQERYDEALQIYELADALESKLGVPHESMIEAGFALITIGRNREATELYRKHLPDLPEPRAHGLYAYLLLLQGQMREGWQQYEFRWLQEPHLSKRPGYAQPQWAGQPLTGKTILLVVEQGAGDIIQFARYATPLKTLGASVVLQVRPEFVQLARGFDGVDYVFAPPTPPPTFDYHLHLMSAPDAFATDLETIPAQVPYVRVRPEKAVTWAARIPSRRLNIGIAWAGNPVFPRDKFRSIPFEQLGPLWDVTGVNFFSLQKPLKPGELEKFPTQISLVDLSPELFDFSDTAAAISRLDLVICVDTAIAHLAGALGKPVWLLLPQIGDFRWQEVTERNAWYPTMRLFRQRKLTEWGEVIAQVKEALQDAVQSGSFGNAITPERIAQRPPLDAMPPPAPTNIARVTETRYGIMQYFPEVDDAARSIAWYGEFLQPQLNLLAQFLAPGAYAVEVGSGIGVHALPLAQMIGDDGHLFVYESRPVVQRLLGQNLGVNRLAQRVTLMRRRLSRTIETPTDTVPTTESLDELLLDRLDLLKIRLDADATAAEILDGANETLWRLRPVVAVDVANPAAVSDLAARVRKFGYRCWRMETRTFSPDNFNRRDSDIFEGATAWTLLAIPEERESGFSLADCTELSDGTDLSPDDAAMSSTAAGAADSGATSLLGFLRKLVRPGRSTASADPASSQQELRATGLGEADPQAAAARSLNAEGQRAKGLAIVDDALAKWPVNPDLLFARATILFDWARYREARDDCVRAEAAGMRGGGFELLFGRAHFRCGDLTAAEVALRRALTMEPNSCDVRSALAIALLASGKSGDAEITIKRALELRPGDFECHWILGNIKVQQADAVAAEKHFRQAIASDPQKAVAWNNLGAALHAQRRGSEAIDASTTAMRLESSDDDPVDSFVNLAVELADNDRLADALAVHEQMLPKRPHVYGHLAYSQALLKSGRLAEGWHHYEFRFLSRAFLLNRQAFPRPIWSGQNLQGRTILLLAEQGSGDTIQFIRYARRLQALGATVLLRVPDGLEEFAQGFPGVDKVLERGQAQVEFDYYLYVVSLPHAFGIDLASIPADSAYLVADPVRNAHWSSRIAPTKDLKVGLAWAGNPNHPGDHFRSMPLATLAPLARVAGVQFFALQKGAREDEAKSPPSGFTLADLGPELTDFSATAAAINQLDLIITVDTAVAHLAAAMGKPVWVMLPKIADWRWLEDRSDSPWYPTMRLFRQRTQGVWNDVIDQVLAALQRRLEGAAMQSAPQPSPSPTAPQIAQWNATAPAIDNGHRAGFSAAAFTRLGTLQYLPDETCVGDSLRWYGEVLQPYIDMLTPLIRPAAVVMEVGAGVGAHALALAAAIGDGGHLILYESQPVQRQILRQNLAFHGVKNVTLMQGTLVAANSAPETLDELRLDRLDLLKIGVGTNALEILAGGADALWRLRPALSICDLDDGTVARLAAHLKEFGYRCWRAEVPWFNPRNFNRRDEDMFAGRVALVLLALPEEGDVGVAQDGWVEIS